MKLLLKRIFKGDKYTIGKLYIDDVYFCDTIEDVVRELPATCPNTPKNLSCACKEKIYGETAIPTGTYKMSMSHSARYGKNMPRLHDVPHFLGILIHSGNTEKDSEGCIIVGENKVKGKVINSRVTFDKLLKKIGNETNLEITIE